MASTAMEESHEYQNKFITDVHEHKWTLHKWFPPFSNDKTQRDDLTCEINTGKPNGFQTKWVFGIGPLMLNQAWGFCYETYWKMVEMKNFKGKLKVSIFPCGSDSTNNWLKEETEFEKVKENEFLDTAICKIPVTDTHGEDLTLDLKLTLKIPIGNWTTHLHKMCLKKAGTDFLEILKDKKTADLKIITSDEKELFAHKNILKARCPVFEFMFRSNYVENNTGIVNVEDISGKTMGILLHFFYSGQLLPSWSDQDTVVEFLYAAGKYQITEVLEILDFNVGAQEDNNKLDEQLLDITNKLGLSNAEARLMRHIKKRKRKIEVEQEKKETIEFEK